jgi:oligopeptide transport system substrate-binding protein
MRAILLSLFLSTLLFASCQRNENRNDSKVFNWNINAGITSLDPAFARAQNNIWAVHHIYNTLLELDENLVPQPSLAKSWEIEDDGKLYRFHLRNDVYFHDHPVFDNGKGRKVTAHDVAFSLNRIIDPSVASPGAWIFNDKVAITSENGKTTGSFTAINDTVLEIRLIKPFPPLPGLLTMAYCSVVPFEVVNYFGKDFRNNPVGSGPFKLRHWEEGNRLVLEKYEKYFEFDEDGNRLPYLEIVNFSFLESKQTEFFSFLKGDLDMVSGIDASFTDQVFSRQGELREKYRNKFKLQKIPFLNSEYFGFLVDNNAEINQNSPLKDVRIRQAINYGFDREKMISYIRNNIGMPAKGGFVPRGLPSFDTNAVQGYTYDPQKAAALLREAGYPNGKGLPVITVSTNPTYLDLALFIQNQLQEIGIKIKIDVNPPSTHREWMANSKVNFFRGSWIADYPDAENYLALFYSPNKAPNGPNYTHFSDQKFDELYEKAQHLTDDSARFKIYHQMENIIMEQAPVVPLYYDEIIRLVQNNISNLPQNAINLISLKKVRKE